MKGNRFPATLRIPADEIQRALGEIRIVRPTLSAPVILPGGDLKEMSWGFRRKFRGAKGMIARTVVNSREDKLTSPTWREAFQERRCLIPAVAFYEWVEDPGGKAVPLRFTREDEGGMLIAGVWEAGESGLCFSMVTTEPSDFVGKVHDRMPAVLSDDQIEPYLNGAIHEFGSSSVALRYVAAENFLKSGKAPAPEEQGRLF